MVEKRKPYCNKEQLKKDTLKLAVKYYNKNPDIVVKMGTVNGSFVYIGNACGFPQFVRKYDKIEFSPAGGKTKLVWEECNKLLKTKLNSVEIAKCSKCKQIVQIQELELGVCPDCYEKE